MKKMILTSIAASMATFSMAQTNITVEINHLLNGEAFNSDLVGVSNLGEEFEVSRLEYYLSGFSLSHDGGQVTTVDDLYVLADARMATIFNLGEIDADHLESITFFIGVDADNNHTDPTTWPFGHPLYPQMPSMHWGWASGYRFVALEGTHLASDQMFQIHGLEDENYFSTTLPLNLDLEEDGITIQIDGNYENILNDISVANGLIVHGGYAEAVIALENMANSVFTFNGTVLGVSNQFPSVDIRLFPNPSSDGSFSIAMSGMTNEHIDIAVFDILGKKVSELNNVSVSKSTDFKLSKAGIYFVKVSLDGKTIATQKLVVQ